MMNNTAQKRRPEQDLDTWIRACARQIRAASQGRHYGVLRVEFFDGRVTRATFERSIKDPESLAPEESDRV
jgi:hypothetical protein